MNDQLLHRLKEHVRNNGGASYGVASPNAVQESEQELGFQLPPLLTASYAQIGNGGFCPPNGVLGVNKDGYTFDFGDIVGTYNQLKSDKELDGEEWKHGMLPFFEWGCNRYSCVDCLEPSYPIHNFEDFELDDYDMSLDVFFEKWIEGKGDPEFGMVSEDVVEREIINPFTGEKAIVRGKTKKNK